MSSCSSGVVHAECRQLAAKAKATAHRNMYRFVIDEVVMDRYLNIDKPLPQVRVLVAIRFHVMPSPVLLLSRVSEFSPQSA